VIVLKVPRKIYACISRFCVIASNENSHVVNHSVSTVSQKINLLNQLTRQNSTSSNGMNRTLDIIREDLGHLVETEGTYWDSRHPHIFVVMGASVSFFLILFFLTQMIFM
jgi:hypothetical protein